ncbi:MAG: TIGR04086 family membrane protein [Oscillospiraceae bacterium]|nr:TIGR04086 family membrane protein [Oscillospiraceae bacterium]
MSKIKNILISILFGFILIISLLLIASVVYKQLDFDRSFIPLITKLIFLIGSIFTGALCAYVNKKNGLLCGVITSSIISVFALIIGIIFGNDTITVPLVITVLLIYASGIFGGVFILNVGKNKNI